jgi:hypothetical protein
MCLCILQNQNQSVLVLHQVHCWCIRGSQAAINNTNYVLTAAVHDLSNNKNFEVSSPSVVKTMNHGKSTSEYLLNNHITEQETFCLQNFHIFTPLLPSTVFIKNLAVYHVYHVCHFHKRHLQNYHALNSPT